MSEVTVVLPDGQTINVPANVAEKLIQQYQEEGYTVVRQGNIIVVTTQPKQA